VTLDDLGKAKRIVIDKDTATIVGGWRREAVQARCADIGNGLRLRRRTMIAKSSRSDWQNDGSVAVVRVGAL
jgi:hypothetical protein